MKMIDRKKLGLVLKNNGVMIVLAFLTIFHWIILIFHVPIFAKLPGWFWWFIDKSHGWYWLVILLFLEAALLLYVLYKFSMADWLRIGLLILLGVSFQFGFAFYEGRGLDGIKDRIVRSGHTEFAYAAVVHDAALPVAKNYETLLQQRALGKYAMSKPPGQLLFYMATKRISTLVGKPADKKEELKKLQVFASIIWPFFSYLILIPLFLYTQLLFDKETAFITCVLYVLIPSVTLITLHTDQVLFPLLFMIPLLLAGIGAKTNRSLISWTAGISVYLACYFTFALVFVVPFVCVTMYILLKRNNTKERLWLMFARHLFVFTVGIGITGLCFFYLFNYDIFLRYSNAMAFHQAWKRWENTFQNITVSAGVNILEFILWLGLPVFVLAVNRCRKAIPAIRKQTGGDGNWIVLTLFAVFLFIAFIGKTRGEVARLWLFLVPFFCIGAAREITPDFKEKKFFSSIVILFFQFFTIFITKAHQDFW